MARIFLVRHGQASFGAAHYDQLSALGVEQSRWLGEYFASMELRFAATIRGSLQRHEQTLGAIVQGMGGAAPTGIAAVMPGLNEYDGRTLMRTYLRHTQAAADLTAAQEQALATDRRAYFRLLREALGLWTRGILLPTDHLSYAEFASGAMAAVQAAAQAHPDSEGAVLIVSSGGPISSIIAQVLRAPPETSVELNLQTRNASVSGLLAAPRGMSVLQFNVTPQLDRPDRRAAITYH